MDSQSLLNGLKDLFSSLGAKTSDSNYAVGLFDKTSKEPKGVMGMSDLASVLGEELGYKVARNGNNLNLTINGTLYNYGTVFYIGAKKGQTFGLAFASVFYANQTKLFTAWMNNSDGFSPDTASWHEIY